MGEDRDDAEKQMSTKGEIMTHRQGISWMGEDRDGADKQMSTKGEKQTGKICKKNREHNGLAGWGSTEMMQMKHHLCAAYEDIIMSAAISGDQGGMWKGGVVRWVRGGLSSLHELFRLVRPKWIWRPTKGHWPLN